jgi:hypothetical protein
MTFHGAKAMKKLIRFKGVWSSLVVLLIAFTPADAVAVGPVPDAAVEEQALEILRQASEYLTQAKRFSFRARVTYDVEQAFGQKLQFGAVQKISVRRPNRAFTSILRDDGNARRVWYNGHYVTLLDEKENVYGTIAVPGSIDATLDYVDERGVVRIPVSDLLYSDLSFLETRAQSGIFVGESRVDGVLCNHLAFRNESVDWQIWIEKGKRPFFRKFLITYKQEAGHPQFAARLDRWNLSPQLPDSLFEFSPPRGAERIRFLTVATPLFAKEEDQR